jgi:RNA polymerase sigma-70 factor (ECF subfamily)
LNSPPPVSGEPPGVEPSPTQWFAEKVYVHDSSLKAYLRGSFPAVRDVDDVVQESYLRMWRRHLARPILAAKGFLFQVARHLALDVLRHERKSPINPVTDLSGVAVMEDRPSVTEQACTNEEINLLVAAIDSLPGRCREIYMLRKLKGVAQKDIARQLGIAEQTVEVQIGRANRRCEEFLRRCHVIRGSLP